jgi:CBS domain-containing protein
MVRDAKTVTPQTTVGEAAAIMQAAGYGNLPVVGAQGAVVGIVSNFSLVRRCLPDYLEEVGDLFRSGEFQPFLDKMRQASRLPVSEMMDTEFPIVSEDTPLAEVASLMVVHHVHLVPVVGDGRMLGVVGIQDILTSIASIASSSDEAGA